MVNRVEVVRTLISPETATDELILALLDRADSLIMAMTNRDSVPDTLMSCSVDLAIIGFNRLGVEGEGQRTEGALSRSFEKELPEGIKAQIYAHRKVRVPR